MTRILTYIVLAVIILSCAKSITLLESNNSLKYNKTYDLSNPYAYSIDLNIDPNLKLNFIAETKGSFGNIPLSLYGDFILVSDLAGNIFCYSDTSDKKIGLIKSKGEITNRPAISKNKLIYAVNNYGEKTFTLYFYLFHEGEEFKKIELNGICKNEIIVQSDGVIVTTQTGDIYKFSNAAAEEWHYKSNMIIIANPILVDNTLYVTGLYGKVILLDLASQRIIKTIVVPEKIEATPIVNNNLLYIPDVSGKIYCFDIKSGEEVWGYNSNAKIVARPVLDNHNNLFVCNLSGDLYSLNAKNGELNWQLNTEGVFNTNPLVFDNFIFQPDLNKKLLVISKINGILDTTYEYSGRVRTSPVFSNDKIFIGVDRGELFVYEAHTK